MTDRGRGALAGVLAVAAVACGGDGGGGGPDAIAGAPAVVPYEIPLSPAAAAKLPELNADPALLPADVDGGPVVMLLLGVEISGKVRVDGPPIELDPSALRFARAITRRRTEVPRAWAMIREAGAETVRYWIPLDPSALIRANVRLEDHGTHVPNLTRVPDMYVTQHVPFFPEAEIEFVRREGTGAGRFRFGVHAEDPVTRIDR